jgi:diaminopropionate ammonia-lyase
MHAFAKRLECMILNPRRTPYQQSDRDLIGWTHAAGARHLLNLCPAHCATPLLSLPILAAELCVSGIYLKAEWSRLGLSSFKGLGGAYAVALLVMARAQVVLGRPIQVQELVSAQVRAIASGMTMVCASAGNHGLSVAAGAKVFGAHAIVVLSAAVSEDFAARLREQRATVVRVGTDYEESMAYATATAAQQGWQLVSDSSWPGYTEVPLDVMRGYTVLFDEAANTTDESGGPATHVFIQAGVGGLAAAAAGYLRDRWGESFKLIVVEPEGAPCLLESVRRGQPVKVTGTTSLGRLDCKQPSLLAFDLLCRLADAFLLVSDANAETAAMHLAREDAPLSACGAAGAAGLITACNDDDARQQLGLNPSSRVLLIGTEAVSHFIEGART